MTAISTGEEMHRWARDLFPMPRSITGPGVRQTLNYLNRLLPEMTIHSAASGTAAFDWTVPDEWVIRDGWIEDEDRNRIVSFAESNLHVVGYSTPVDAWLTLEELQPHLHSLPDQPDAIPYVTSYYERRWGFCLEHERRERLAPGRYHAYIDSDLHPGALNYGELVIRGRSDREILLSTYICHPSMANNELSGPVVTCALARWLQSLPELRYTFRVVFIPETIGSLVYLSRHLDHLRQHVRAGFNITCIGDDRAYSYLPSRAGDTLADRAALHVLEHMAPGFCRYTWLDRGSDERQYCAPGIDLPVASIMRSKYGEYPEYHTSLDNLDLVTPSGLTGGLEVLKEAVRVVEGNCWPRATVLGEPQLGRRGLYPTLSHRTSADGTRVMMDLLSYADGRRDALDIATTLGVPFGQVATLIERLADVGLLTLRYD